MKGLAVGMKNGEHFFKIYLGSLHGNIENGQLSSIAYF